MTRKVVKFIILILEVEPYNWLLFSWSDDVEVAVEMVNTLLFESLKYIVIDTSILIKVHNFPSQKESQTIFLIFPQICVI